MQGAHNGKPNMQRRDATGHLNPKYAADLRKLSGASGVRVYTPFVERPRSLDPLAEALGEEFVAAVTTGDEVTLGDFDERITEDDGGPFVITRARAEFGRKRDGSNPAGSTREPFPLAFSDGAADGADEDASDARGVEGPPSRLPVNPKHLRFTDSGH